MTPFLGIGYWVLFCNVSTFQLINAFKMSHSRRSKSPVFAEVVTVSHSNPPVPYFVAYRKEVNA